MKINDTKIRDFLIVFSDVKRKYVHEYKFKKTLFVKAINSSLCLKCKIINII